MTRDRLSRRQLFVLLLTAVAAGTTGGLACKKPSKGSDAGVSGSASTASTSSSAQPLAASATDRLWVDARGGDPLELARLSDVVGAHELAEVADDDKASEEDRATAFRALAFADDPTPALPALTRAIEGSSLERSTLALQTLAVIAPRRRPIEEVEPGAWRPAAEGIMKALVSIKDPVRRELGIRALLGLAERGAIKRELIPTN